MSTGHPDDALHVIGDVGGTYARFSLFDARANMMSATEVLTCAEHADLAAAVAAYLSRLGCPPPKRLALAVACPVHGDLVELTNNRWRFSIQETRSRLGLLQLEVMNDFTALALALPSLEISDLTQVGGTFPIPGAAKGLIGAGTGLGVSGLVSTRQGWTALDSEGGHVTFAPTSPREREVVELLSVHYGHVSAERLCSGAGLSVLHAAIRALDGEPGEELAPSEVVERALHGSSRACVEAVDLFCAALGSIAGNLTLTLGARGGLYVAGGIVPRLGPLLLRSPFRERFEAKGRFRAYLAPIPVYVINHPYPALLGLSRALAAEA